jgi:hypothetical protein
MKKKKPKQEKRYTYCFLCEACLLKHNNEGDHWPIPQSLGGTVTVRLCITCHDMKDRVKALGWPISWTKYQVSILRKLSRLWHELCREEKIYIAKAVDILLRKIHSGEKGVKEVFEIINNVPLLLNDDEGKAEFITSKD